MPRNANDTPTRTETGLTETPRDALGPALVVVQHDALEHVGSQRELHPGTVLALGRVHASLPGVFEDELVSREHARVTWGEAGAGEVVDLGSRNGTFVNGQRVTRAAIGVGDVVRVGRVLTMVLMRRTGPASPSGAGAGALVGMSEAMREVRDQIGLVGPTDTTVLILGETGVGKELVAEGVHAASQRAGRFVPMNCASVPDGVLASELFGHARGAFSGAQNARPGLVEAAKRGTLFLDEIGDASAAMQQSLLRLLERREYRALGSDQLLTTDARFVAATQPAIAERAERGTFRQDLWMRLARWVIRVPPLRARREDVPLIARVLAERAAGKMLTLDPALGEALLAHAWPANVRELQAIVERIVVGARGAARLAVPTWLAGELAAARVAPSARVAEPAPDPEDDSDAADASIDKARRAPTPRPTREVLVALLTEHAGNIRAVCRALDVRRTTLYRWLTQLALDAESFRDPPR